MKKRIIELLREQEEKSYDALYKGLQKIFAGVILRRCAGCECYQITGYNVIPGSRHPCLNIMVKQVPEIKPGTEGYKKPITMSRFGPLVIKYIGLKEYQFRVDKKEDPIMSELKKKYVGRLFKPEWVQSVYKIVNISDNFTLDNKPTTVLVFYVPVTKRKLSGYVIPTHKEIYDEISKDLRTRDMPTSEYIHFVLAQNGWIL